MSILTSSSGASVSRGYYYYKYGKMKNVKQLNDYEFEGYVYGSQKDPYYVRINIKHPRKSHCDCPYANGNIVCKHMVSLYFSLFPDEVDDYEAWMNSDYEEDEDDYDDDYDDYRSNSTFKKLLFFDEVLDEYVNSLDVKQLRDILTKELKQDEKRTYNFYLDKFYKEYLNRNNNCIFLEKLKNKINELTEFYSYEYEDFDKVILNNNEKKRIKEIYGDSKFHSIIDKILLNENLAVYSDYKWVCNFYRQSNCYDKIKEFTNKLNNYLDSLKHYSIRNDIPKSNLLINIYLLNDYSNKELAYSLYKNPKYLKYVNYVVEHNSIDLYYEYIKLINKNYLINKQYVPNVLNEFYFKYDNDEIRLNYLLYSYLCLKKTDYLEILKHLISEDKIINMVEVKTKDVITLTNLYKFFDKKEKLWNLLINSNYNYLLLDNVEILRDKYNDELYNHFINNFYDTLKEGKSRDVYNKASTYVKAISKLNNGYEYVNEIISDLKDSDYKRCSALFEEISNSIKKN